MDEKLTRFLETVVAMRTAQRDYFVASGKARKTKATADWAASSNALKKSKALEIEVDRVIPSLIKPC